MSSNNSSDSKNSSSSEKPSSSKPGPLVINSTSVTAGTAQEDTTLGASGQMGTTDTNVGATQAWNVKSDAKGNYGSLAIDNTGKWTYTLNNSATAVQGLAEGTSKKDSFTVRVTDSKGASAEQLVTVTVSGTNDAPVISQNSLTIDGDSSSGKVKGTLLYTDPDRGDKHTSNLALKPLVASAGAPDLSASLSQALRTSINDEGENGKGALKWDFALPSTAPKLTAGQAVLANYQLSVADNHGGASAPQDLGLLIVGTGSTPKVYSVAAQASLTEGSAAIEQTSGVISGKNLGLEDKGSLTSALVMASWSAGSAIPAAASAVLASALSTSTVPTSKGGESDKNIAWQFSAADPTFDFLASGETLTLAYKVSSAKDHDGKAQVITITITGTNDAPMISSNAAAAAGAAQEDTVLSATGTLSATDVDHGATQTWSVKDAATGTYGSLNVDSASGQWTYALDNASAATQALAAGETHDETFTVRVTDDKGATADQTVTITVTGTNDAPVITANDAAATGATQEDTKPTATGNLLASDVDNGATQAWSVLGSDTGAYGQMAVNASTGNWTYTLNNASAAVQSLVAGESHNETFTVRVTDDKGAYADQTVIVSVTGTNDVATVSSDNRALTETNSAADLSSHGSLNVSDVDTGEAHVVAQANTAGHYGTFNVDANGNWSYAASSAHNELAAGQQVSDSFSVTSQDGTGTGVVNVAITGSNDAPEASAIDAVTNFEEVTVSGWGFVSTTGLSGGLWHTDNPSNMVEIGVGTIYGAGTASHVIELEGDAGSPPNLYTDIAARAGTAYTVSFDYSPRPGSTSAISVFWGDNLIGHLNGTTGGLQHFSYAMSAPADGIYRLEFRSDDSNGAGGVLDNISIQHTGPISASLTEKITPAGNLSASGAIAFTDADLSDVHLVSAAPTGDVLGSLTAVRNSDTTGAGTGGKLAWNYTVADTAVEYLAAGQTRGESFNVTIDDQHGGQITKQIDVTIIGTNDAPVAVADSGSQKNNEVKSYAVLANDTDVDTGAVLSLAGASVAAGSGSVHVVGGQIQFDPGQDFKTLRLNDTTVVNIDYTVADDHGAQASSTLAVTVIGTNTPPTAVADTLTTNEDTPLAFNAAALLANDTDPDAGDTKSVVSVTSPTRGTLVDGGNGNYTYTPGLNYNGPDAFSYTMRDTAGEQSSAHVNLNVNPVNDAPVAVNDSNALTATTLASQAHSNVVSWVDWTSSAPGTVSGTINLGNGQTVGVTYSGEYYFAQTNGGPNFYNLQNGTVPVGTYTSAAVANGPNGSSDIIALNQQTQKTLTFTQPVDNLFFAVVSLNGMAGGINNGYLFDHDFQIASSGPGYFGQGAATKVALPDGRFELLSTYNNNAASRELHGVVQIDGTVQSLTWTSLAAETWNGFTIGTYGKSLTATATGQVLANDSDLESDPLTVTAVNNQAIVGNSITLNLTSGAELTVNKNGTYLYDENGAFGSLGQGQTKPDNFTYTVSDGHGGTNTATATITVTGVNDAPTMTSAAGSGAVTEDVTSTSSGQLSATDPDQGTTLAWSVLSANGTAGSNTGAYGSLLVDGTGKWTYTLNNSSAAVQSLSATDHKSESFVVQVSDGLGGTATQTVTVAVNGASDTYVLSNLANNGSFEGATTGWTLTGDGVDVVSSAGWQPGDGTYSVDLNAFHPGGVQQILQTTPGVQYTVGFDLSKNPGGHADHATVQVSAAGNSQSYTFSAGNSASNMMWSQQAFTFTATGATTTLNFASTYPNDTVSGQPWQFYAEGPALDEVVVVSNKTINNFSKGVGGDVLQLSGLLTSIGAPHDNTAFGGGFVRFQQSGADTLVQIDSNGGGDAYMTVATLIGQSLAQADTANYVL
ncbi:MAG: VCBS domain-containing protein [Sterolibacterium sp.]